MRSYGAPGAGILIAPILVIILVILVLVVLASCVKIVPQAQAFVVERLGGYQGPGM